MKARQSGRQGGVAETRSKVAGDVEADVDLAVLPVTGSSLQPGPASIGPAPKRVDRSIRLRNCAVAMRDGTRLAADVYLPGKGEGPRPVLVERTPYHKERLTLVRAALYFSRYGYAVVLQDVRGRFDSEGDWWPTRFEVEAEDGYDTLAWLVRQPWCNGKVGTIGLSYGNSTQSALASLRPPGLAAQFRCQGQSSYYRSGFRMEGGALDGRMIPFMFDMAGSSQEALSDPVFQKALEEQRQRLHPLTLRGTIDPGQTVLGRLPSYEQSLIEILTHGDYDGFWRNRGLSPELFYDEMADVPVMLVGSWYDMHTNGTLRDYVELSHRLTRPVRLVMGPWIHGEEGLSRSYARNADFGAAACFDYNDERRRWFDHVLKGEDTGVLDEPPIKLFIMGGGSGRKCRESPYPSYRLDHGGVWRWEREWPLARTRWTSYYLHPGGRLAAELPRGPGHRITYRFDPADPVPTVGGSTSIVEGFLSPGGADQRDPRTALPLNHRADVISFQTDPLPEHVEITGSLKVTLFVSSDAPDTDFTAKLIDVYPPSADYPEGYALNLADGIMRARYHGGFEAPVLLEAEQVYRLQIDLGVTANLLVRGHRIRLDVSSSNYPKYDINPNTGEPQGRQRRRQIANNTVYFSAEHPSHIVLPIIPCEPALGEKR